MLENLGMGHFIHVAGKVMDAVFTPEMQLFMANLATYDGDRLHADVKTLHQEMIPILKRTRNQAVMYFCFVVTLHLVERMPEPAQIAFFGDTFKLDDDLADEAIRFLREKGVLQDDE